MLSLNKIKYLKSLNLKKNRIKEKKIILDGKRLIDEAMNQNVSFEHIWINESLKKQETNNLFFKKIINNKIDFSYENEKNINKISNTKNSQGIVGLISVDNLYNQELQRFNDKLIVLDQISDPGNLGTIVRTCAWFGIKSIILSENSADIFNDKCVRSSVGGHFFINNLKYMSYDDINNFLDSNNFLKLCADLNGEQVNSKNINKKWALILGSEAHGINNKLKFDKKITILKRGQMESLNISVASGIILNELLN